jgi:hypothetical protein
VRSSLYFCFPFEPCTPVCHTPIFTWFCGRRNEVSCQLFIFHLRISFVVSTVAWCVSAVRVGRLVCELTRMELIKSSQLRLKWGRGDQSCELSHFRGCIQDQRFVPCLPCLTRFTSLVLCKRQEGSLAIGEARQTEV